MPALIALLAGALARLAPYFVTRILVGLGIGVVNYAGLTILFQQFRDQFQAAIAPWSGLTYAYILVDRGGVLVGINIILSALAARVAITAAQSFFRKL
jgi:hypothetical protein